MSEGRRSERERITARRKRAWLQVIGAVGGVAVIGAGILALGSPTGDRATETATPGEPAPVVRLTDFDGKSFSLQDYEGRPVVVNFWASWCPFCVTEMPDFEKVHRSVRNEVAFLGIDHCESCGGGSADAARNLARETGVTYRLAEDPDGSVFVSFGGSSMPTTVFIDADGRVVEQVGGMLSESQLRDLISQLFGVRDA